MEATPTPTTPRIAPANPLWLAATAVGLLYILTLALLPNHVFWSPDEGGKFLQAAGLQFDGKIHYSLPYGGRQRDPNLSFYPPGTVYPQQDSSGRITFGWPFLFPALAAVMYRSVGLWGLYVLPAVSGIVASLLAGTIMRRLDPALAWLTTVVVGICSPVWFYSILLWEHSLTVAIGLGAVWAGMLSLSKGQRKKRAAGFVLALAFLLLNTITRFEMLIPAAAFLGAWVCILICRGRESAACGSRELLLYACLTLIVCCAAMAVYFLSSIGTLAFPSYVGIFQGVIRQVISVSPEMIPAAAEHIQSILINEPTDQGAQLPTYIATGALLGLLATLLVSRLAPSATGIAVPAAVVVVSLVALTVLVDPSRYRALHGILIVSPYCTFAIAALTRRPGNDDSIPYAFLRLFTFSYLGLSLVASFLLDHKSGGLEWGARHGLILFPLLTILALIELRSLLNSERTLGYRSAVLAIALFSTSVACMSVARGVLEVRTTKQHLSDFEARLRTTSLPVVTDLWWAGAALSHYFVDREFYTVDSGSDVLENWLPSVGHDIGRFVYMTYGPGLPAPGTPGQIALVAHTTIHGMSFRTYETSNSGSEHSTPTER